MFKKLLASVGIGAAKVDTVLETDTLMPGQPFRATIEITAGDVEQDISGIELALVTRAEVETDDGEHNENIKLQKWLVQEKVTLQPGQTISVPFEAMLHQETPITALHCNSNRCQVWLATGLEIDMALDASDKDPLNIVPTDAMRAFVGALENCGYYLNSADVEKGFLRGDGFASSAGAYQELEFRPQSGGLFGIKEVEVSFVPESNRTHVLMELDRSFRGDGFISVTLEHSELSQDAIEQYLQQVLS
ncbi:MAG: sporulation protein [Oceanospirillaceae bacterium]|nr:sporulation protein [Oceanospirillaceae bacterium]